MYNIGIDFGGSHVAIGVVTIKGKIVEQIEKNFTVQEKQDVINVGIKFIVKTLKKLKEKYEFNMQLGPGLFCKNMQLGSGLFCKNMQLGPGLFCKKKFTNFLK